ETSNCRSQCRNKQLAVRVRSWHPVSHPVQPLKFWLAAARMHAATQVHESAWLRNERSEHVRSHHIHRQHVLTRVDASIMDDGIERTQLICLVCDASGLFQIGQIANDGTGSAVEQILYGIEPLL